MGFWKNTINGLLFASMLATATPMAENTLRFNNSKNIEQRLLDDGRIKGRIVDSQTGEPLPGANIIVPGTTIGTATDINGNYTLPEMPEGVYTVQVRMMGYATTDIKDVSLKDDELKLMDIALKPSSIQLEDIVIEAKMLNNTESSLLKNRQKSESISDAISQEEMSRYGSSNASDVMKKVTGASVIDGKYIYVRGLGERYSTTHLNGAELPTSDPDKKTVHADLFPSNLLDNITTLKTFTPDKPGNFSGGIVDINTKSHPEKMILDVSLGSSYNTQSSFNNGFIADQGSNLDWLGYDNGARSLPEILADENISIPSPVEARIAGMQGNLEPARRLDALSKAFNEYMSPVKRNSPVNQKYSLSFGNQYLLFDNPLGLIAALSYDRNSSFYEDGIIGRYSLTDNNSLELNPELLLRDKKGSIETTWGAIANLGYTLEDFHELGINYFYSKSGESTGRYQIGTWPKEFGDSENKFFENHMMKWTERDISSIKFKGEHLLPALLESRIDWYVSNSQTEQDEPDTRFFADIITISPDDTAYTANSSGFSDPTRYFRKLEQQSDEYALNLSIPFSQWSDLKGKIKVGGMISKSDRQFRERAFSITPSNNYDGNPEEFYSDENSGIIDSVDLGEGKVRYIFGNTIRDNSKPENNYDGIMDINAVYAMTDMPINNWLRLIAGARYETTDMNVESFDTTKTPGIINVKDILPSVNLLVQLADNINLRAAYTKTLARPTFREIAPFASFEFINSNFFLGNPDLERTLIDNYDLRAEWFMNPGEIAAISGFYKNLKNPIERTILGGTNGQTQFQNVDKAIIYGLELELRKNLGFLTEYLKNFNIGTNLTISKSEIDLPESELIRRLSVDPDASDKRELQGHSPYLLNINLTYNNGGWGSIITMDYNTFGDRLSNVSIGGTPDVYERARHDINLIYSQKLLDNLNLKLSAKNILNSPYKETYEWNDQEYDYYKYTNGRTFSIGLSYNIQ